MLRAQQQAFRKRIERERTTATKALDDVPDDTNLWVSLRREFGAATEPEIARLLAAGISEAGDLGLDVALTAAHADALDVARRYIDPWWEQLTQTTRDGLRRAIIANMESGAGTRQLIRDIEPLFGKARAQLIAVTENTRLYAEGNRIGYRRSGVEVVEWRTARDDHVDERCAALQGQRWPLGQEDVVPPEHVRCRCTLSPIVGDRALTERA